MQRNCVICNILFDTKCNKKYCSAPCRKVERKQARRNWYISNVEEIKANTRAYYKKNKIKVSATNKLYRAKNPDKVADQKLRAKFGIGLEEYNNILDKQGGVCAICGTDKEPHIRKRYMSVDHCHATGKIRGILCSRCNMAIGLLEDSVLLLKNSLNYLQESSH